jgi:hypothetical protein
MANEKDFGNDYLKFHPSANGKTINGLQSEKSQVCIDGWFTAEQLRNIANELDRLESEMKGAG